MILYKLSGSVTSARSGVVITDQSVSPAVRAVLKEVEHRHGSPAGTATFAGRWVAIEVTGVVVS